MKKCFLALIALMLTACQTTEQRTLSYENMYSDYSCKQLKAEMSRISSKIDQVSANRAGNDVLNAAVAAFAISQGYKIRGNDKSDELDNLNAQFDTLDRLYIKGDCVK